MNPEAIRAALRHRRAKGLDEASIMDEHPLNKMEDDQDGKDSDLAPEADEGSDKDMLDDMGNAPMPGEEDMIHDPMAESEQHEMDGHPELQHVEAKAAPIAEKPGDEAIRHAKVKEALMRHSGQPQSLASKVSAKIKSEK